MQSTLNKEKMRKFFLFHSEKPCENISAQIQKKVFKESACEAMLWITSSDPMVGF